MKKQRGFILIETLITVVLLSAILIGFRYTLYSYYEVVNRSFSCRYLEQIGNSTVEYIARNIINAKDISLSANQGNLSSFYVTLTDEMEANYVVTYSGMNDGIKENGVKIFNDYPPLKSDSHVSSVIGPKEEIEITEFKGEYITRPYPPYSNPPTFYGRVFQVTLKMKYTRQGDNDDINDYEREFTFTSQVSLKMNEIAIGVL